MVPAKRLEHDHGPPVHLTDYSLDLWQKRFLSAYGECGSIRGAARTSKIVSAYHYRWLKDNADYSAAYQAMRDVYADIAEGEVRTRGIDGWQKPLSYKGKLTGDKITEYSDVLALAVLKALKPEYRDGQQIAVGPAKISIEITNAAGNLQQGSGTTEIVISPLPESEEKT